MREWLARNPTNVSLTSHGQDSLCNRCKSTNQRMLRKAVNDRGRLISYNPLTRSYMIKFKRIQGLYSVHEDWIEYTPAFRRSIMGARQGRDDPSKHKLRDGK